MGPLLVPEASSCSCVDACWEPCLGEVGEEKATPPPAQSPGQLHPDPSPADAPRVPSGPGLAAREEGPLLTLPSQGGRAREEGSKGATQRPGPVDV